MCALAAVLLIHLRKNKTCEALRNHAETSVSTVCSAQVARVETQDGARVPGDEGNEGTSSVEVLYSLRLLTICNNILRVLSPSVFVFQTKHHTLMLSLLMLTMTLRSTSLVSRRRGVILLFNGLHRQGQSVSLRGLKRTCWWQRCHKRYRSQVPMT